MAKRHGHIIDWFFAAPGIATPETRLLLAQRMVKTSAPVGEIVVYKNGTCVVVATGSAKSADAIMREYDVPADGEGGFLGDIDPIEFDDGVVMFIWVMQVPEGELFYFATKDEIFALMKESEGIRSPTEKFKGEHEHVHARTLQLLAAGLAARRRRTLDAREPVQVARWVR